MTGLPPRVGRAFDLSRPELIRPDPTVPAQVPTEILGEEPDRGWCFYYEKADLARQAGEGGQAYALAPALGVALIALYAQRSIAGAQASTLPLGFTGIRDRWSAAGADLLRLADDHPMITNNPEMVYFLVDLPAYFMPILYDPYQQQERSDFEAQLALATQRMKDGSVLVIFGELKPWEEEALKRLVIVPLRTYDDVVIYGYPSSDGATGSFGRAPAVAHRSLPQAGRIRAHRWLDPRRLHS